MTKKLLLNFVLLFFLFNTASAQSCDDGSYSWTDDISAILTSKCSPCHINSTTSGWNCSTYAGTLAAGNNCGPGVTPGDINSSSLYNKIKFVLGNPNASCGSNMPTAGSPLSVGQANAIVDWISGGAQENCPVVQIEGCTDLNACNYNSNANIDDGSCINIGDSCDDLDPYTINDEIDVNCYCTGSPIVPGCIDNSACNFNPDANQADGSCLFVGAACDDGNMETVMDVINDSCQCVGIIPINIEESDQFSTIEIFPVPTSDLLNLKLLHIENGETEIAVYNMSGIKVKVLSIFTNNAEITIDLSQDNLSSGTYLISLTQNDKTWNKKFLISR